MNESTYPAMQLVVHLSIGQVHRAYRILGDEDRYSEGWVAMFLHGLGSKTVTSVQCFSIFFGANAVLVYFQKSSRIL